MPQDPLQIGLEHHRNGRLTRAESSYREALRDDPGNPEVMHWLGVLHMQAGDWDEAILWLEQAVGIKPTDAAYQHNLGQAYLARGDAGNAVHAFEAAALLAATRAETRFALGIALTARRATDDAAEAVIAFRQAIALGLDAAEAHRQLGASLLAISDPDAAIECLRTALAKKSEDARSRFLLAMAHKAKGETSEVRKNLLKSVEIDTAFAPGWKALGDLESEAQGWSRAAALYRRAITADATDAGAYQSLAAALRGDGRPDEAMAAMRQSVRVSRPSDDPKRSGVAEAERRITLDSQGAELHYTLATVTNLAPPSQIPAALLADLFDRYADTFDEHLRTTLQYTLPEQMTDAIAAARPAKMLDVLDLGCGTGLCGPLLRPWARWLAGIDLSPAMIEQAKARQIYDRLEVCDLVDAMRRAPATFDLLVAADVLLYVGDLSTVFEAALKCLRPGGLFAYSVEAGAGDRYYLQTKSKRFAHSEAYLKKLGSMHGFIEESFEPVTARLDAGKPVPAYLAVLRTPGA